MNKRLFNKALIIYLIITNSFAGYTQTTQKIYSIGDIVPDLKVDNVVNASKTEFTFSDFKGKLIIIDFWASWCGPCVASFTKLDSLQKEFKEDIQILPVTYEAANLTSRFLQKVNKQLGVLPMSVTNDTALTKMFPHTFLPHYVWIDENRKVIAITEAKDVTRENIIAVRKKKTVSYTLKQDALKQANLLTLLSPSVEYFNSDRSKTINLLDSSSIEIQSIISKYIEGLSSGVDYGTDGDQQGRITVRNRSIMGLYRVALFGNRPTVLNATMLITEIPDTTLLELITGNKVASGIETVNWLKQNGRCYQLRAPKELNSKRFDLMLSDLNRFFEPLYGIEGVLESRKHSYLALIKTSPGIIPAKITTTKSEVDKFSLKIHNEPLSNLIGDLTLPLQLYPPILDETNYTNNVDIELNCKLSDLKAVNDELSYYGLKLIQKEKFMNVAVIRMKE